MEEFLEEYSKQAMVTATYPNVGGNLSYPAKAIVDEWGEIHDLVGGEFGPFTATEMAHEIGDEYWEVNALIVEMGYSFSMLMLQASKMHVSYDDPFDLVVKGYRMLARIEGRLKKYERDIDSTQLVRAKDYTVQFLALMGALVDVFGLDLKTVLQMNLTKLSDRANRGVIGGDGDER